MKNKINKQFSYLFNTLFFLVTFMLCGLVVTLYAQNNANTTQANTQVNAEDNQSTNSEGTVTQTGSGLSKIVTNVASDFEQAGKWYGTMFSDYGWVQAQRRRGYGTVGDISLRKQLGEENSSYTLGLKVNFRRMYYSHAEIIPPADIQMYGTVNKITVWAFGRNTKHKLYAVIEDARGKIYRAPFFNEKDDTLDFEAWQKLEAVIPEDAQFRSRYNQKKKRVVQYDNTQNQFYNPEGIKFKKFLVEFDAPETTKLYYLYLDQLEYVSDVYRYEKYQKSLTLPENEIAYPIENW